MFTNKKIFLVCAENFSWPMHYLAQELRKSTKNISALFIQPGESYFNSIDYRKFCQLNRDLKIFETSSISKEYIKLQKNSHQNLDKVYIQTIEKKYTHFSGLNEQFLTEMTLTPYYHDRRYYKYLENDYNWKHYVITYDKSEEEFKFYINNSLTHTHSNHTLSIEATDFVIGSQLGYNESWYGKIDELGVWNRILSSQEITDLYNNY